MKAKWVFPFLSWLSIGYQAALSERWDAGFSMEIKLLQLVGAVAWTVVFLAVLQPWREDPL